MQGNNLKLEILKNPLAILESEDIFNVLKKHWINNHQNLADPEKFVSEVLDYFKQNIGGETSNKEMLRVYEKKLKEYKLENIPKAENPDMFYEMLMPELADVKTILDFGCGKLTFLKNISDLNKDIEKLIGVDAKSNPILKDLDKRISFERNLDQVAKSSVDLAVIKLVLHHLEEKEIMEILKQIKNVLKPNGKLIVFEESFSEGEINGSEEFLKRFNLEVSEATEDFLKLSSKDRIKFLFLNDWLMNLQNAYMPWTLQYKSMEEWKGLIESVGFQEKESHFIGAVKNRKRKQGMTAVLIFEN